ncbi:LOW QUALITY PROTEIN: hypothetical protein HZS_3229 [Henneguya salminicola]|nr:LOW QUALITY PROTEIN: hypothetical protein HZS_3229 [Henneguya salminicola]
MPIQISACLCKLSETTSNSISSKLDKTDRTSDIRISCIFHQPLLMNSKIININYKNSFHYFNYIKILKSRLN